MTSLVFKYCKIESLKLKQSTMEEETRFVSVSVPRIREMRCLIGRVDPNTKIRDSSVESSYHFRILKCRSLIDSLPEIIASPGIIGSRGSDPSEIYILTKDEFLSTGKIKRKLDDMDIKYSELMEVTPQIYKECLLYTILSKLSPKWNRVENYLIAGKNFLASISAPTRAIKLDIVIDGEGARLAVSPACLTIPAPLCLPYFALPSKIIQNFLTNDKGSIQLCHFQMQAWVFVLPSLKRGRVVSISKEIPESCRFRDYEQLRGHWKNMYGYQLPKTDLGLIYYQINFPGLGWGCFTYPSCCVSSAKLDRLPLRNGRDVASQFLQDLTSRVPDICGTEFKTKEIGVAPISHDDGQEEEQKENLPDWVAKNIVNTWNPREFGTPYDLLNDFYPGSECGCKPVSTISNSPVGSLEPKHNIIKEKSLGEALTMKPFSQFQSANRKYLTPFSNEFVREVENKRFTESSRVSKVNSGSFAQEKVETSHDESSEIKEDKDEVFFGLLRSRSSFDLNHFSNALGEKDPSKGILDGDLEPKTEKIWCNEDEVEVKSHYFEDLVEPRVEKEAEERRSSSKPKLYRLSNRRSKTAKIHRADFKTKDISSYFKAKKSQVRVSEVKKHKTEISVPARFVQTQLNFLKRSGGVESCVENKKTKLLIE